MLITSRNVNEKPDFLFSYFVFYVFFYWVFSQTVFGNRLFVYVSFIFLLGALLIRVFRKGISFERMGELWIPYFLYTALGYLFQFNMENFSYWIIGLLLMLSASNLRVVDRFNCKLVLYMGIFLVIGVGFHYFFTDLYNNTIAPLYFQNVENWSLTEYGYCGFTYQLGVTAILLNIVEMLVLYIFTKKNKIRKKWFYWLLVVVIVLCTFLTGKRTNSVISIVVPFVIYFLENRKKRVWTILLFFVVGTFFIIFINTNTFLESFLFRRFNGVYDYDDNYMSNRMILWSKAIEIFNAAPIFGVGVDRFMDVSHIGTGVHSIYLQCLCEQGVFGFLLFIIPLVYCLVNTIHLIRIANNERCFRFLCFSLAIQLRYIIDGITENDNSNLMGFLFYAFSVALAIDCKNRLRYKNNLMIRENDI